MHKSKNLFKSFLYALKGIALATKERNFTIQLAVGTAAIILAVILDISGAEMEIIIVLIALVLASEAINSAIERLLDFVSQERRDEIREIKDLMAGAVLIFSVTAAVVGTYIFANAILR